MKNNWKKDELGNLIEYCARGVSPSYTEGAGVIVLNQKCIRDNKISLEPSRITDSKKKKISEEKYLKKFDILVNSTGVGTLGRVAQFKGSNEMMTADSHVTIVRPDDKKIDPFFLGYVMSFKQVEIEKMGVGATGQTELSRNTLKELKIGYPEKIEDQKKIADVLSAHDDLIENNNRRIKILEEMAQLIYKEWFVDFKFPGHEKVKMVEGELGLMPEDWVACKLKDVIEIIRGRSYSRLEIDCKEGYDFVNLKCFNRGGGFRRGGLKKYSGKVKDDQFLQVGDIVMAVTDMTQQREIVARVAMIPKIGKDKITFSCDVVKILPKNIDGKFLYFMLRFGNFADETKSKANGANVLHLNPKNIEDFVFMNPTNALADKFGKISEGISKEMDLLNLKNNNLRQTRDVLLPKLMSGEIKVYG